VVRDEGVTTPAAEWFVDNFHIVDAVVRQVREDLPRGFYRQLPKLAEDPLRGYPRVLGLAWAFVAHTDSRFEPETLQQLRVVSVALRYSSGGSAPLGQENCSPA